MIDLYRTIKELSNLKGFDIKTASKLFTPFNKSSLNKKWGIFNNLNLNEVFKVLKNNKDKLTSEQFNSINRVTKDKLIEYQIKDLINLKRVSLLNCISIINYYINNELKKDDIVIKFDTNFDINLEQYTDEQLLKIKNILEWLPNNPCIFIKSIIEIEQLRNSNNHNKLSK